MQTTGQHARSMRMNRMKKLKITFNAPLVLGFSLCCLVATLLGSLTGEASTARLFSTYAAPLSDPLMYLRLMTHVLGHTGFAHLIGNLAYILLRKRCGVCLYPADILYGIQGRRDPAHLSSGRGDLSRAADLGRHNSQRSRIQSFPCSGRPRGSRHGLLAEPEKAWLFQIAE